MVPAKYDITVYRGDWYDLPLRLRERLTNGAAGDPLDLTGATITAQIRASEDETAIIATFAVELGAGTGEVTLSLTPAQTTALSNGVYDVQVIWPDEKPRTYLRGSVTLIKDVTRT